MGAVLLIVDDSRTSRKALMRSVEMSAYPIRKIYEVSNGQDAWAILREHWVDLVFTDLNMPIMDGEELLRYIRSSELLEKLPVVMVSSEGGQAHLNQIASLEPTGMFRKPFRPEKVKQLLHQILGSWEE
jgi:two-component system chemotaxis response regulator CheY